MHTTLGGARVRRCSLKPFTAALLGFCAACSTLWKPWIDHFGQPCSNQQSCPTGQVCSSQTAHCEGGDMGGTSADMMPLGCGVETPYGKLRFAAEPTGTSSYLRSVWGADPNNVWAVGDGGIILKWDGSRWSTEKNDKDFHLLSVWGTSTDEVVTAGVSGAVLRRELGVWKFYPNIFGNKQRVDAIWGSGPMDLWAVGNDNGAGFILHANGMAPLSTTKTTAGLAGLWGYDANNLWATASDGTVHRLEGSTWTIQESGIRAGLNAVWGTDPQNVWVVGDTGNIRKWNGKEWLEQKSNTTTPLFGLWGSDACNLWAVGLQGAIVRWNGVSWTPQQSDTQNDLRGIWGSDARNMWITGDRGTALRLLPQ